MNVKGFQSFNHLDQQISCLRPAEWPEFQCFPFICVYTLKHLEYVERISIFFCIFLTLPQYLKGAVGLGSKF